MNEKNKIQEIDSNFMPKSSLKENGIVWYDGKKDSFVKYGIVESKEDYLRMPREVADTVNIGTSELCDNTSGVRIRFCTDSPYIAINAFLSNFKYCPHMPLTGSSGFDLYKEISGQQFYIGSYIPSVDGEKDYEGILYTGNDSKNKINYILNFPSYNGVIKLYIGLKENSITDTPNKYYNNKPVLFYGSSITQGACASRPGNIYQNILSRALNMDYISLGFSASAQGEQEMAEYMADIDMCAFVSDYDYNAPTAKYLENTHFNLYQTIRKKNSDIPYIMISHPSVGANELVQRRKVIMQSYINAIESGDKNVYFIDGDSLFSGFEYDGCTVDNIHPNDLGFYRMAQGMLPILKKILYTSK